MSMDHRYKDVAVNFESGSAVYEIEKMRTLNGPQCHTPSSILPVAYQVSDRNTWEQSAPRQTKYSRPDRRHANQLRASLDPLNAKPKSPQWRCLTVSVINALVVG